MALEYRLQIKTQVSLLHIIENYLKERCLIFLKQKYKSSDFYLKEELGFMISILSSKKIFFEYMLSENQVVEEKWDYSNDIYFRLDKFYDNVLAKINMIEICIYILNNTKEDAKLIFNGDILVLERINGLIHINKNFGFWNGDLLSKVDDYISE